MVLFPEGTGVDSIANAMSLAGNSNVYTYRFDWDEEPSIVDLIKSGTRCSYGLEIPLFLAISKTVSSLLLSERRCRKRFRNQ